MNSGGVFTLLLIVVGVAFALQATGWVSFGKKTPPNNADNQGGKPKDFSGGYRTYNALSRAQARLA